MQLLLCLLYLWNLVLTRETSASMLFVSYIMDADPGRNWVPTPCFTRQVNS